MADRRRDAKHSRARLPVGTIRIHARGRGGLRVRFIKYRTDGGYSAANWMPLARWWWLQNKGDVPAGYRVVHADGDTLNDDPTGANYELMTPGDVIGNWHFNNPAGCRHRHDRRGATSIDHRRL